MENNARWGWAWPLVMLAWLAFSVFYLITGLAGIDHHLGLFFSILAALALVVFRFSIPIAVGCFFGARDVWGWHWIGALLFTLPGLAYVFRMGFAITWQGLVVFIPATLLGALQRFSRTPQNSPAQQTPPPAMPTDTPIQTVPPGATTPADQDKRFLAVVIAAAVALFFVGIAALLMQRPTPITTHRYQPTPLTTVEAKKPDATQGSGPVYFVMSDDGQSRVEGLPDISSYRAAYVISHDAGAFATPTSQKPYHRMAQMTPVWLRAGAGMRYDGLIKDLHGNMVKAYFNVGDVFVGDIAMARSKIMQQADQQTLPPTSAPVDNSPPTPKTTEPLADEVEYAPPGDQDDASDQNAGNFPLSHISWGATMISLTGFGTNDARAQGRVTLADVLEYCRRDPNHETDGTSESLRHCMAEVLSEERGVVHEASADCHAGIVEASALGPHRYAPIQDEGLVSSWLNLETGRYTEGMDGVTVGAQYTMLCGAP